MAYKIIYTENTKFCRYLDTSAPNCVGEDSCCTSNRQCDVDQGDCDSDSECKQGLKCGSNNCKTKSGLQWDAGDDCCYKPPG